MFGREGFRRFAARERPTSRSSLGKGGAAFAAPFWTTGRSAAHPERPKAATPFPPERSEGGLSRAPKARGLSRASEASKSYLTNLTLKSFGQSFPVIRNV